ncbi:putative IQ motif, EF-hand binding protein [Helianthus annuus]|nr:protein IQ-DOMAIN 1 [Helianthus annuus]XP_035839359.1 protein IQ-DOMAIN 1 [Helianthus annuus]KAJ0465659.1 putative IQ motif, EF-hand binding protein [Helianthus annuus]KAJ0470534.1 putative IQ motif, EF-hand binding protein [Helianthus annuus]KAJ0487252.1 putative IQ motif, EF-hand binding protein [Helianthus annuus]KAJ0661364.1 putative IQ motif, EF-hand binding protein [Helianthus annuus]KAJ0855543.1 putative IQ motif, EF-hand binding protein [Helianthus annuus]
MGKKSSWLSAVKKALSPSESKEKKDKKSDKKSSKKYWFGKQRGLDQDFSQTETRLVDHVVISPPTETKLSKAENEQTKHAYSVAYATAVAAEAAVAAAHAAAEVVRLTATTRLPGISTEEIAAIKIQAAYRGHLARRAVRAVRGLGRLKSLIQGQSVKRQAISTLKCMQTLARVQSQVRSRRILMSEENRALQQQLLLKHEKELNNIRSSLGNTWDDSRKSKEETEASLQSKQEAAIRRERALAYAHTHQQMWKNSTKYPDPTFLDPNNPHWGWSWLERWMAAKPWETQIIPAKEPSVGSEMGKRVSRPPSRQSPSTPPSRAPSSSSRVRPETPRGSVDGDSTSFYSVQSDRNRRQSRASSVCDNESLDSSPAVPSYMASTMSAKARSRMASPVHSPSPLGSGRKGSSEKGSMAGSAKKRLSFSGSPARTAKRFNEPLMMVSNS